MLVFIHLYGIVIFYYNCESKKSNAHNKLNSEFTDYSLRI